MEKTPHRRENRAQTARSWLFQAIAFYGLWFVFTGAVNRAEVIAGALCAGFAATLSMLVLRQRVARFDPDPRLLGQAWRMPWYALQGTGEILVVLAKHFAGKPAPSILRAVHFDAGPAEDPRAAARRALAVAYTTATPNFVVIGIDGERGLLLYHQLKAGEILQMTRNLGARP